MNILVALAFMAIIGSLVLAMLIMLRGDARSDDERASGAKPRKGNMARALAFRVGFSILLFVCVLLSWKMGWIHPTGIPVGA